MKFEDGFFKGVRNTSIYHQRWLPDGAAKASLLIVHGLAEHSGRYQHLAEYFTPLGYALFGFDHIGHGKSGGDREYVVRFRDFIDVLDVYRRMIQEARPNLPVFLVGHSMGGLIAAHYLLEHQRAFQAAVLSAPIAKTPSTLSPLVGYMGKVLSAVWPKRGLVQLEASLVSRDPDAVQAYVADPLVHKGKTSARLAAELLKAMKRIMARASAIRLPILILQGSDDKLVDPDGARLLYDLVSSTDKTLTVYDGLYHEIFNEPEQERVFKDLETWIEAHSGTRPPSP